jgi:YHS domain-containing protein
MLLRIILISVFFYLLLRFFKLLFLKPPANRRPPQKNTLGQVNEMVQDPVCKVYIPKNKSLSIQMSGSTYYFCCKECMNKFKP